MYRSAAAYAKRATDDILISPDLSINMEICDIINMYPGQAKDALKVIKKQLGSKRPITQLLALYVLDALIKNCGESVIQKIIKLEILLEMVKIIKTKPNTNVKVNIFVLMDIWQETIGVKFPQFIQTFHSLMDIGIEFTRREESFTPPLPRVNVNLSISKEEMQTAKELAYILMEMLNALDLSNSQAINQELIVDLTEQCQGFQKRVQTFISNTSDESLLYQGLAVNEILQRVLRRREEIANGYIHTSDRPLRTSFSPPSAPPSPFRYDKQSTYDDTASLARLVDPIYAAFWEPRAKNEGTYDNFIISRQLAPHRDKESEDALFRELVEFVRAIGSPSSSTSNSSRDQCGL